MATQGPTNILSLGSAQQIKVLATLATPLDVTDITLGLGGFTRAVRCETDGTLRIKKLNGDTEDLPFKAGETQHIIVKEITTVVSGTCLPITLYG